MGGLIAAGALAAAIVVGVFALIYALDRSRHAGIDLFRRRRILAAGIPAIAWVNAETTIHVSGGRSTPRIVKEYELDVRPPDAGAYVVRSRVEHAGVFTSQMVERGAKVPVRIDPRDRAVVIIDVAAIDAQRRG